VNERSEPVNAVEVVRGLEAIIDAAAGVLAEQSLDATLHGMVRALGGIVPFTSLAVYEADHQTEVLIPVFAVGRFVEETLQDRPPFDASIAGMAVRSRETQHVAPSDPRMVPYTIPGTPVEEPSAMVVVPLLVGETVIGTLTVWREGWDAGEFAAEEAELIRRFGTLAALAYANARQREQLRDQALTDTLTGLANRRHFDDRLAAEMTRTLRDGTPISLVVFDLDDFKSINDRYGHPDGDVVLCRFADVLRAVARASDLVCRTGGEEFAVILPGADAEAAATFAERANAATREARLGPDGDTTTSAGVSTAPAEVETADTLFRLADDRLLQAKARGKDRVVAG
jgi:diguanylate cyclase (GGDEF)-like protein